MFRVVFETNDANAISNTYFFIKQTIHTPSTAAYTCAVLEAQASEDNQNYRIVATQYFSERKGVNSECVNMPLCTSSKPIVENRFNSLLLPTGITEDYIGPFMYGTKPSLREDTVGKCSILKPQTEYNDSCLSKSHPKSLTTAKECNEEISDEIQKSTSLIIGSIDGLIKKLLPTKKPNKKKIPMFIPNAWGLLLPNETAHSAKCNYWIYSKSKDLATEFGDLLVSYYNIEYYDGAIIDEDTEGIIIKEGQLSAHELSIICNKMVHKYGSCFYLLIMVLSHTPLVGGYGLSVKFSEVNIDAVGRSESGKEDMYGGDSAKAKQELKIGKLKVVL